MRPLELTLKGFRSYREETTFDWRGRSLVGIVGPIGSGKSSILDAIAFALYGKTPTFERDTKSLIHQLCDECHVTLQFEVDGQVWRAVRALRRKGASGHQLWRVESDAPDAPHVDEITGDKPVRERVEQLLGMEFDAFCRSVLLAQNRFADFLKATPNARNDVLKGVFGYERFDAALQVTKRRVAAAEASLAALSTESDRLQESRVRLGEAQARLDAASKRTAALEGARAAILTAEATRRDASERAEASAEASRLVDAAAEHLGDLSPDAVLEQAEAARSMIEVAERAAREAAEARKEAEAGYEAVAERVGDASLFATLVQHHAYLADAVSGAGAALEVAEAAAARSLQEHDEAAEELRAAEAHAAAAAEALEAAEAGASDADAALDHARHADMAWSLRAALVPGAPCPVCDQQVAAPPPVGGAPEIVAAEADVVRARDAVNEAQAAGRRTAGTVGRARARLAAAAARREETAHALEVAADARRRADAELTAAASQLVDRLGEGDPKELLEARRAELREAEARRDAAIRDEMAARDASDAARRDGERASSDLTSLATRLATAWGMLGERRADEATPEALRSSFIDLGETVVSRHAAAVEERKTAAAVLAESDRTLARLREDVGLGPDDDLAGVMASAAMALGSARQEVDDLVAFIAAGADLEARLAEAARARDLAARLATDLQPGRFLAFLLEEERSALARIGSTHFDELSNGGYRFTDDDRFDVLDLNAAATERKADSLSGGETFLASLALALALAEMVARGGGRLDAFFLDEGFGSLDPEHLDRAMEGIGRLVVADRARLVVLVSHVAEMRDAIEDLVVLDKDPRTGDTVVISGAAPVV